MTPLLRRQLSALYTACAGGLDAITGPWLVFAPASALAVMGIEAEYDIDLLFLSFVGSFVAALGFSYLWALWRWLAREDIAFLRMVWRVTVLFRLTTGTFCATQIILDQLDPAWGGVALADFLFAGIQIFLLRAGWPKPTTTRA